MMCDAVNLYTKMQSGEGPNLQKRKKKICFDNHCHFQIPKTKRKHRMMLPFYMFYVFHQFIPYSWWEELAVMPK